MRDHVLLSVNGRRCSVSGEAAFLSLADFLRGRQFLAGTKVVCAEGDCGACTVLVGRPAGDRMRYEPVDSCILFLYQLDGTHVVTVEGLKADGRLSPVQEAMVACHGSQCGYCTPGFVMALTGLFEENARPDDSAVRLGLTGNLCRCTGYVPILEATRSVDPAAVVPLARQYESAALLDELWPLAGQPLLVRAGRRTFFRPCRLEDALDFRARNLDAFIVAGNTELGVLRNKGGPDPPVLLSLAAVPGLSEIVVEDGTAAVGANVTWTQLERFARDTLPEFYKIIIRFGSPQIRNVATLAGNVVNGSPIADALPFLYIMEAELELAGRSGTRRVPIDGFYRGYKVKDMAPDELITRVRIPLPAQHEHLRLYKVSRRNDLDIATFGAGVRVRCEGTAIAEARIAYSGVAPTVVRLRSTEAFLRDRPFTEETFDEAGRVARAEVRPISDVRGARDYRLLLAENILRKFHFDCMDPGERGALAPRWDGRNGGLIHVADGQSDPA